MHGILLAQRSMQSSLKRRLRHLTLPLRDWLFAPQLVYNLLSELQSLSTLRFAFSRGLADRWYIVNRYRYDNLLLEEIQNQVDFEQFAALRLQGHHPPQCISRITVQLLGVHPLQALQWQITNLAYCREMQLWEALDDLRAEEWLARRNAHEEFM